MANANTETNTAVEDKATANGANQTSQPDNALSTISEQAASDLAKILVVDQSLVRNLAQTILPAVQEVSDDLLRAVEPVLHEYQEDVARAVQEQIRQAFPAVSGEQQAVAAGREEQGAHGGPSGNESVERDDAGSQTQRDRTAALNDGSEPSDRGATTETDELPGGKQMSNEDARSERSTDDESTKNAPTKAQRRDDRSSDRKAQRRDTQQAKDGNREHGENPTYFYDPQGAARAGLLRLATDWKEAGSSYQAIHAYMEILLRYPQTGAAAAATEGLVDLANTLQKQGRFYAALNIYDKLEAIL